MQRVAILILCLLNSMAMAQTFNRARLHKTSFEENVQRYPSPSTVLELIRSVAPVGQHIEDAECSTINADSGPLIGAIDPLQGEPLESEPGAFFFRYFERCVEQRARILSQYALESHTNSVLIFGEPLLEKLKKSDPRYPTYINFEYTFWKEMTPAKISPPLRFEIMSRFVLFLIGPGEVLQHFGYIGPNNVFRQPKLLSASDLSRFLVENVMMHKKNQNRALWQVYADIASMLRLGPILKN